MCEVMIFGFDAKRFIILQWKYSILEKVVSSNWDSLIYTGVPGGKDLTSGECSLGQTIPK
jgi:hypothetical protein